MRDARKDIKYEETYLKQDGGTATCNKYLASGAQRLKEELYNI